MRNLFLQLAVLGLPLLLSSSPVSHDGLEDPEEFRKWVESHASQQEQGAAANVMNEQGDEKLEEIERPTAAEPPPFVFWHLEKAGGTYAKKLLGGSGIVDDFAVVHEQGFFGERDPSKHFYVGLAREPCSYYVSLFLWGVGGRSDPGGDGSSGMGWLYRTLAAKGQGGLYNISGPGGARKAFSRWIRAVSRPSDKADKADSRAGSEKTVGKAASETCGPLSARLWTAVVNSTAGRALNSPGCEMSPKKYAQSVADGEDVGPICPCPLSDCANGMPRESHSQCRREIRAFDASSFQCWIHLENSDADLKACLKKYRSGKGYIDVRRQLQRVKRINQNIPRLTQKKKKKQASRKEVIQPSCSEVMEPDTAHFIMDLEEDYAAQFGYAGSCCGSTNWESNYRADPPPFMASAPAPVRPSEAARSVTLGAQSGGAFVSPPPPGGDAASSVRVTRQQRQLLEALHGLRRICRGDVNDNWKESECHSRLREVRRLTWPLIRSAATNGGVFERTKIEAPVAVSQFDCYFGGGVRLDLGGRHCALENIYFTHVWKAAGHAIYGKLKDELNPQDHNFPSPGQADRMWKAENLPAELCGSKDQRRLLFTAVRNPISKFVSGYREVVDRCSNAGAKHNRCCPDRVTSQTESLRALAYVSTLLKGCINGHVAPQSSYIMTTACQWQWTRNGWKQTAGGQSMKSLSSCSLNWDFVAHVETMTKDWHTITARAGCPGFSNACTGANCANGSASSGRPHRSSADELGVGAGMQQVLTQNTGNVMIILCLYYLSDFAVFDYGLPELCAREMPWLAHQLGNSSAVRFQPYGQR